MRKFYQTAWHGISFESFAKLSASELPDASFYTSFYEALHRKYKGMHDLDPTWVSLKSRIAEFIANHPRIKKGGRTISVGCGLGLIEMALVKEGFAHLEITEVSQEPLYWSLPSFPPENVHIGFFPDCICHREKYDLVLLIGVEYFLNEAEFSNLLRAAHERLLPGGICLLVSWSFDTMSPSQRLWARVKDSVRYRMDRLGIKKCGQFWGYVRRLDEFRRPLAAAGFTDLREGILRDAKASWNAYWIEATKNET